MLPYTIYINGNEVARISGTEAAFEAWKMCGLALLNHATVDLVDGLTGEVLATNEEDL